MKFKFDEGTEPMQWFVSTIIGDNLDELMENYNGELEVLVSINGIDVDFTLVADSIDKSIEFCVNKKFKTFLTDATINRIRDLNNEVYLLEERVRDIDLTWLKGETNERT